MIGKTLGHYAVSTLLGKGGMGEVYKAKDQKLGRDVAIKVLPEEFAKDADRKIRVYGRRCFFNSGASVGTGTGFLDTAAKSSSPNPINV